MKALLDVNILTKFIDPSNSQYAVVNDAINHLWAGSARIFLVPQTIYELWVVCTRPQSVNGLGMSTSETAKAIAPLRVAFDFLDDPPGLFSEWERLVIAHQVEGKAANDARLVAAMNLLGLTQLLTFNGRHFARYSSITTLDPQSIALTP